MQGTMSDSAKLAVGLIVTGFVLFILANIVLLGKSFSNDFVDNVTGAQSEVVGMEIESIAKYNGDIPAASVYVALSKNRTVVDQISGTAYGVTVTAIEDLTLLFKYQIHVTVLKNDDFGTYRITISP